MARSRLTLRAARWSATHPWRALLVWVVFVAGAVAAGSAIATQETTDADYRLGESGRADEMVSAAGVNDPDRENVVITAGTGGLDRDTATEAARALTRDMSALDAVAEVGDPVWSPSEAALLVPIELERLGDGEDVDVAPLQAVTEDIQSAYPDLVVRQAGDASVDEGIGKQVEADLASAEKLSLPLTLGLMLLAFGALIAAGIPVLLAISGVVATIGIYAPISYLVPSEPTVSSMILLIGMAVGVDYSLFYLKREREERAKGHSTIDAVEIAAATSGHSIIVSGAAVIVSMAGLYVVQDATFSSLATGAIIVVAVAVLGSVTVLPALLAKLGRWVDRPRVPLLWRVNRRSGSGGISRWLLAPVLRRPKTALALSLAAMLALCAPALGMTMKNGTLDTLPSTIPEVQTLKTIDKEFPSEGSSMQVVVRAAPEDHGDVAAALRALSEAAVAEGGFVEGGPDDIRTSEDGTVSALTLVSTLTEGSDASKRQLEQVRGELAPELLGTELVDQAPDAEWAVGGLLAENVDYTEHQSDKLPWVIGFVLLLTLLMMGLTFRSVTIALMTTVLNLLSVGAAFGVLTLVFQYTWAEGLLDFTSSGFVINWIPLFLFVVLVGLSMDYHVFVLSRIREGAQRGLPPKLAVEAGITETAGVVTSAAAVMVSVFAIFATLSMLEMKQMGVGLAVAILIDATVVRVVMLPAMLTLLGERAWWPSRIRRVEPIPVDVRDEQPAYALTKQ